MDIETCTRLIEKANKTLIRQKETVRQTENELAALTKLRNDLLGVKSK